MPLPTSPSILLAAAGLSLVLGLILRIRIRGIWEFVFFASLILASYSLYSDSVTLPAASDGANFRNVWLNDALAVSEQWLILTFAFLNGIAATSNGCWSSGLNLSDSREERLEPEFQRHVNSAAPFSFLLFVTAGLMFVARSNDFLSLGLSLEIVSLSVTAFNRVSDSATVLTRTGQSIKEDFEGPVSARAWLDWLGSTFFWIGAAFLVNVFATTQFDTLRAVLIDVYDPSGERPAIGTPSKLVLLAAGLIVLGIFARMRMVPFHFGFSKSLPSGSIQTNGFTILSGQLAASIALARVCGCVFVGLSMAITVLIMAVTLATFFIATVTAAKGLSPGDRSIPRWLSCLSLLQSAWMGIGVMIVTIELDHPDVRWGAFPTQVESLGLIVFLQVSSILASSGVYWIIAYLARSERGIEFLEDLKGLGQYAPVAAFALVISLASAVGCPWTAGFWGRWLLILAGDNIHIKSTSSAFLPHTGLRLIVLVGAIATVLIAGLMIRLVREIVLEPPLGRPVAEGGRGPFFAGVIATLGSLILGVAPQTLLTPLRSIDGHRAVKPQSPQRGSGKNRSVFRMRSSRTASGDEGALPFAESSADIVSRD